MKMTFRWFGAGDPVTLDKIREIPLMSGIVSAVYDVPPGELWPQTKIDAITTAAAAAGLSFEVVESLPVHEEIKLGSPESQRYIDNYCANLARLGEAGIKVVCYNFMPVFDWLRTELARKLPDGSHALAYEEHVVRELNPATSELALPGWDESYTRDQLRGLLSRYAAIDAERLWRNLERFLVQVIPAAEAAGIRMAIHADDPPWSIFGLPRIITGASSYERLERIHASPANSITFCSGSLGAGRQNELTAIVRRFAARMPFVHLRNIRFAGERDFTEAAHPSVCGSLDMYAIVKTLYDSGFDGYIRPDHGRMIWGESGRPGYGLYDRALGAVYLQGLWEAVAKQANK